jgi:regulator of replication initiation timing
MPNSFVLERDNARLAMENRRLKLENAELHEQLAAVQRTNVSLETFARDYRTFLYDAPSLIANKFRDALDRN